LFKMQMVPDEQTRKDLMVFIKGLLREAVPAAITEKLNENGWLDSRFNEAVNRLNLASLVRDWLSKSSSWETGAARLAIRSVVESNAVTWRTEALTGFRTRTDDIVAQLRQDVATVQAQVLAKIDQIGEQRIRAIVAEELRKRLGGG